MTADMLVSSVLPATPETAQSMAYSEVYSDPPGLFPLPEEEPLIAKSVAKRRNEFITVRHCARIALGELGLPPVPILKGDKGEPCWPDGVVGSLTHCAGYRGAVVGRSAAVRSVGIDAEPHDVLPNGVLDAISLPAERTEIPQAMPDGLHWDRILFCAKEATYKAWFPLTKRWLGFEDAHISFEADGPAGGAFESQILIDPEALSGPPLTTLRGRWAVDRGLVLTAIVL
jgi:4'-phosphopantetheinyl transferase EntD